MDPTTGLMFWILGGLTLIFLWLIFIMEVGVIFLRRWSITWLELSQRFHAAEVDKQQRELELYVSSSMREDLRDRLRGPEEQAMHEWYQLVEAITKEPV